MKSRAILRERVTRSLAQVKTWNATAEKALTAVPGYEAHRTRALALLNDPGQIARPDLVMGNQVANHWVNAANPRGLWRISPLDAYLAGKPVWPSPRIRPKA